MKRLGCYWGCGSYHESPCPHAGTDVPLEYWATLRGRARWPRGEIDYSGGPIFIMRDAQAVMVSLAEHDTIYDTPEAA